MKYTRVIIIGLASVLLMYILVVIFQDRPKTSEQSTEQNQAQTVQEWETKTDDRPPVSVSVTPAELSKDAAQWKFDIVLDTHSESLDQDLTRIVELADDKGNSFKPVQWQGSGPGGHHREGTLVFDTVQPTPTYAELRIKDVGGIPLRSFTWEIK